jgi:hypothetical protein
MPTDSKVRSGIVVGAVFAGVATGALLGFVLDRDSEVSPQTSNPSVLSSGPAAEENGVPVGYAPTKEGAVAAATNFNLLSGRDDLLSREALTNAMQTLAAPSWRAQAAKQARTGYDYVVDTYGQDADVSAAVIRYNVSEFSPHRAVVKLWTVTVLSGSARPNVDEVWGIVTINLEWVDADWRVGGIESSPGPAPVDLPSRQPDQPASALMEEFDEFEGAPVP